LKKEYSRRLRLVLGTKLSAKNKIKAFGSWAVPVLRYRFGNFNCLQEELQNLDRKTRKLLLFHVHHHTKADVDLISIPRKYRKCGLMQLDVTYAAEIIELHQHSINSAVLEAARSLKTEVQRLTWQIKDNIAETIKIDSEGWECMKNAT